MSQKYNRATNIVLRGYCGQSQKVRCHYCHNVVAWALVTSMFNVSGYITAYMLIAVGFIMFIVHFLSNVIRNSPLRVGAINRGEFYSVIVVILGAFFYLNTRIDALFSILAPMR